LRRLLEEKLGDSVDVDTLGCGVGDEGFFGDVFSGPENDVRAGASAGDFDSFAQILFDGFEQCIAAGSVSAAKTAQVALIHAGLDEFGEGQLFERGGVKIAEPFRGGEGWGKRPGDDEVADAQGGENGAREGAEIGDPAFGVEALQGLERAAFVVEFAIVVVFDDDGVFAAGPFEQSEAAGEGKNGAGGELVRWGYEDQAGLLGEFGGIEAVAIDRNRD